MSDLASLYQKEVEDYISLIKTQHIPVQDWKGADGLLKQCEQTLTLLEKESRSAGGKRESVVTVVASLRRELDALNQEVKKKVLFSRNRRGSSDDDPEKGGLLNDNEEDRKILSKSKIALKKSTASMQVMSEQGLEIQRQLEEQEQTMRSALGKMNKTDQLSQEGRRHLNEIERGELRNKIFMYGAVIIVFIGIVVMLYYVFFRT